jgi:hypothetical protein
MRPRLLCPSRLMAMARALLASPCSDTHFQHAGHTASSSDSEKESPADYPVGAESNSPWKRRLFWRNAKRLWPLITAGLDES